MRKLLLALTISLILSLVFGGVMVLAASQAEPGNPLYAIHQGLDTTVTFLQDAANTGDSHAVGVSAIDDTLQTPDDDGDEISVDDPLDDGDDLEEPKGPKDGAYCPCDLDNRHPAGEKLAEKFFGEAGLEAGYEDIMGWFCEGGFGFGEIDLAYRLAAANPGVVTVDALFDKRTEGMGWGAIIKELRLSKPGKDLKPGLGIGNGNAGSNGNAYGHDKNQGNGNAGSNGNAYGKTKNANKGNKGGKGKP